MNELTNIDTRAIALFEKVSGLIELARRHVSTTANTAEVYTKYHVGRYIVDEEQNGNERAKYGKAVLKKLSSLLNARFEGGWSVDTLEKCRKLFIVYSKSATVLRKFESSEKSETLLRILGKGEDIVNLATANYQIPVPQFTLSWSHYLILMTVENPDARSFYEIEAKQQNWGVRQLGRQVGSSLYERLALSRDKDEVMRLAREGQTIEKPSEHNKESYDS